MYTKKSNSKEKTVCQVIMETKSWMQEEEALEQQQMASEQQSRDNEDHAIPSWVWPDEDPSDMIFH